MKERNIRNKKVDLLKFQENLNNQFFEISKEKKNIQNSLFNSSEHLGLNTKINNVNFVLSIKDLKSISPKTIFEYSIKTKSWLLGYNQEQGNIYTIFNLSKIIPFMLENNFDYEEIKVKESFNIVYLKKEDEYYGILLDSLNLINIKNLISIYDSKNIENHIIDINSLLEKKFFIEEECFLILNKINSIYLKKDESSNTNELINKIFIDDKTKEIFFMIDIEKVIKFLKNSNPF